MNIKSILQNKTFKVYRNFLTGIAFRLFGKDFSNVLVGGGQAFFRKLQIFSRDFLAILLLIHFKDLHDDILNP
jgi:hypothetical protein